MIRLLVKQGIGLIVGGAVALALVLAGRTAVARWLDAPAESGAAVGMAAAPVAPVLHYQGRLLDPTTSQPKPDGSYPMAFRLYGAGSGGSPLWTESKSVTVSRGLFSTLLGDTTALDLALFDGRELYLGVAVGADPEAQPRQRIAFVAYALYAANADKLGGQAATAFAPASHGHSGADIQNGTISSAKLADGAVTTAKLVDGSVITPKLADAAVTAAKLSGAGASAGQVLSYNGANVVWFSPPHDGLLGVTTLGITCTGIGSINTDYQKITDIGSFTKIAADSILEVSMHGRIAVTSMTGTGALFELRIDDAATTTGRVRAVIKAGEADVNASMGGVFTNLDAGVHTVSIWVRAANGTGGASYVDPGCWSADQVVIKELR